MPGEGRRQGTTRILKSGSQVGGNLIVTDAAVEALPDSDLIDEGRDLVEKHYVGSVEEFTDREHP